MDDLSYEYPDEVSPGGRDAMAELEYQTWNGAGERYPDGVPDKVETYLNRELALIAKMKFAPYFLTVFDIVRFARGRGILCQGRGSAANSAVCYCLGITSVDPDRSQPLFERFISEARGEPPDIDVDFEHERREEVIQYIYAKYGRTRAGLTAAVITYRARSALREVAKVFGLSSDVQAALSGQTWGREASGPDDAALRAVGIDPADRRIALVRRLVAEIARFPRHLSQHVGGFVITRGRLDHLCPISPAAMEGRTVIEWDKDDLDALGLLKVDVLALGMLSCIRRAFDMLRQHYDRPLTLASVPPEDAATYDMLCEGRSVGVFQVESRAQMAMLPRLQPRCFHDLVVQVAIVRPGPIQGDMVHPYLRRRAGLEKVTYPSEALRGVLERTLGVPLFQEQAMQIAIVGAGFHRKRGRPASPRHGNLQEDGRCRQVPRQDDPRHDRARLRARIRRTLLPPDRGVRHLWLSGIARRKLRAACLCLGLDQETLPRCLHLRAAERAADGLLFALAACRRGEAKRRRGTPGRCRPFRMGQHAGAGPEEEPSGDGTRFAWGCGWSRGCPRARARASRQAAFRPMPALPM